MSTTPGAISPPAQRRMSCAVRSAPRRAIRGSWPFSKRLDASERRARRCAVRRMLTGSKMADSMTMSRVWSDTSELAPPITPATARAPADRR